MNDPIPTSRMHLTSLSFGLALLLIAGSILAEPNRQKSDPADRPSRPDRAERSGDAETHPRIGAQLTEAQITEVMGVLEQVNPAMHQRMLKARTSHPELFQRMMHRYQMQLRGFKYDPGDQRWQAWLEERRDQESKSDDDDSEKNQQTEQSSDRSRGLDEAQRERVMTVLRQVHPRLAEHLNRVREKDEARYQRELSKVARHGRIREMIRMHEADPEQYSRMSQSIQLDIQARRLAAAAREAKASQDRSSYQEHLSKLREVVGQRFDVAIELRKAKLQQMSDEMLEVREQLDRAVAAKDAWVEQAVHLHLAGDRRVPSPTDSESSTESKATPSKPDRPGDDHHNHD